MNNKRKKKKAKPKMERKTNKCEEKLNEIKKTKIEK